MAKKSDKMANRFEVMKALRSASPSLFISALVFSMFTNLLMLTGPLFMLQVYDRVLGSKSEETLAALFVLVAALFLVMGVLDFARGRVMARIGGRLQKALDARVFSATLTLSVARRERAMTGNALRDLDSVQAFFSSPAFLALMDTPWTPVFLVAIFVFHPWLGWLAVAGGGFLITITVINQLVTFRKTRDAQVLSERAHTFAAEARMGSEAVGGLGMRGAMGERLFEKRAESLAQSMFASDWTGSFTALIKATRLFLQSAMLACGAYLVLKGELSGGAMIAGSILLGRALSPIEQIIGQWPAFQRARSGWKSLNQLLAAIPEQLPRTKLPLPEGRIAVSGLTVVSSIGKTATLRNVTFRLEPGNALGVIGRSGSGKSTLARAMLGLCPTSAGEVRLGGATLDQFDPEYLGKCIGYLPQSVTLFSGTVAENIARMSTVPDSEAVVSAAKQANAHDMIMGLPDGYETFVEGIESQLSGGQKQRIALARALYGNPIFLILDEPNSALDAEGSDALNASVRAFKAAGRTAVIMTHRPTAISECDMLLVLESGNVAAFGPREEVMKSMLRNVEEVKSAIHPARRAS